MGLTKTTKQPYEKYFVYGDFDAVMETSETIVTATITAVDSEGVDATATVIESGTDYTHGTNTHQHWVRLQDGVEANSPYKFTIKIITSLGNKWEVDGALVIKEL